MVDENNGQTRGSANSGRVIGVQKWRQSNRHRVYGAPAFAARGQCGVLGLAAPAGLAQGFGSTGENLRTFRPLWHWCLDRLPSQKEGDPVDLDSTRLLPKDGQQEGVQGGDTKQGIKPCLHPLVAVLAEVRLVAQLWLRPGNTSGGLLDA